MSIVLGIDPGSHVTGYGLIEQTGKQHHYLSSGCIRTQGDEFADKLQQIFQGIQTIIAEFQPTTAAIEAVFVHPKNVSAALKLGQARGAAIVALSEAGLAVAEYSPRQVKQAIVGYGGASKVQVQHMIKELLRVSLPLASDAADALAIALCHSHSDCQYASVMQQRHYSRRRWR